MTTKCSQCGLESQIEAAFRRERRWLGARRAYCPRCYEKRQTKSFRSTLLGIPALLLFGAALLYQSPESWLGWMAVMWGLCILAIIPLVVTHELAHALVGRLVGLRVVAVSVGVGRTLYRRRIAGTQVELHSLPFGGLTAMSGPPGPNLRLRLFLAILAGPASHVAWIGLLMVMRLSVVAVTIAAIFWSGSVVDLYASQPPEGSLAWWLTSLGRLMFDALFWTNLVLLVASLLPLKSGSVYGELSTDGLGLFHLLVASDAGLQDLYAGYYTQEAIDACQRGDFTAALNWAEQGTTRYPDHPSMRNTLGYVYTRLNDYARARQVFSALARLPGTLRPELKIMLLNNLAYASLMLEDPALLPEADACSAEAYQNAPWYPAITGTRGAVLAALGHLDEGIALLQEALARSEDAHSKATEACHLALAEARRGSPEAARRYLETAQALDPGCYLLSRVEQSLSPGRPDPNTA